MVVVITSIPSPYQVELFDALAADEPGFRAVYVSRRDRHRSWADPPLRHHAMFLNEVGMASGEFHRWVEAAESVVFADYSCQAVREAMRRREASGKPWCFWGERPGYHGFGWLGQMRRRIRLAPLHRSRHVPIWGIGQWAVDEYRREFGDDRLYYDVPYFSNLERFRAASAARRAEPDAVRILYSGALIKRKGVDLLAKAFRRLGQSRTSVTLSLIGAGPLRADIESMLRPLGSRVRFHDFVAWQDLPMLYAQADVLCAPSRYDGWGLIVPEGMAAGMPVIATQRMGSALELIDNGENGWLIRAGDENHLYEALCAAVDIAPSRRTAMGLAAQSRSAQQDISRGIECFRDAMEGTLAIWRRHAASPSIQASA
jgi:glycosyltransferase involved in cell wall biosynthesis